MVSVFSLGRIAFLIQNDSHQRKHDTRPKTRDARRKLLIREEKLTDLHSICCRIPMSQKAA